MWNPTIVYETERGSYIMATGSGAYTYDAEHHRIVLVMPEKPDRWTKATESMEAGFNLLLATEGMKGVEELRLATAKFLKNALETLKAEVQPDQA